MNRREALMALMALPATARLSRATVSSTDVIVIESDEILSEEQVNNIIRSVQPAFPENKIVLMDKGFHLKIAERSQ